MVPSSEKANPNRLELVYESVRDDEAIAECTQPEPPSPSESKPARKGGGRRAAPENLPIERVLLDVPAGEREDCIQIREEVTEEIDYRPSRFIRRHYGRSVYAHPGKLSSPVVAVLPARVIPQGSVGAGFEACLEGHHPVAATDEAESIGQAIDGAAEKLTRCLDHTLGRLSNR